MVNIKVSNEQVSKYMKSNYTNLLNATMTSLLKLIFKLMSVNLV